MSISGYFAKKTVIMKWDRLSARIGHFFQALVSAFPARHLKNRWTVRKSAIGAVSCRNVAFEGLKEPPPGTRQAMTLLATDWGGGDLPFQGNVGHEWRLAHVDEWEPLNHKDNSQMALTAVKEEARAWEILNTRALHVRKSVEAEFDDAEPLLSASLPSREEADGSLAFNLTEVYNLFYGGTAREAKEAEANGLFSVWDEHLSTCGRWMVFIAQVTGKRACLGVRDVQRECLWNVKWEGAKRCVMLQAAEGTARQDFPLVRILCVRDAEDSERSDALEVAALTPAGIVPGSRVTLSLPSSAAMRSKDVIRRELGMRVSKDYSCAFVSSLTETSAGERNLKQKLHKDFFVLDLFGRFDSKTLRSELLYHSGGSGEKQSDMFFEHRCGQVLVFEGADDTFQTIAGFVTGRYLGFKGSHQVRAPQIERLREFTDFHIKDVDSHRRGVILYGVTEVGRPELRVLAASEGFLSRDDTSCYRIAFNALGDPSIERIQSDNNAANHHGEDTSFLTHANVSTDGIVWEYPKLNLFEHSQVKPETLPFYGELRVGLNNRFAADVVMFSLSSFLVPNLDYALIWDNTSEAFPFTVQKVVPQTVSCHETLSQFWRIERAYAASSDEQGTTVPLTIVSKRSVVSENLPRLPSLKACPIFVDDTVQTKSAQDMVFASDRHGSDQPSSQVDLQSTAFQTKIEDFADSQLPRCLLFVYGSSGTDPCMAFQKELLPLLRRNWTLVVAHVRGGQPHSVLEEITLGTTTRRQWRSRSAWAKAARGPNRWRGVEDIGDALRFLVAEGIAMKGRIAIRANSAGAALAAAFLNADVEDGLITAAVLDYPFLDVMTTLSTTSLLLSAWEREEWGDGQQVLATWDVLHRERHTSKRRTDVDEASSEFKAAMGLLSFCPYTNLPNARNPELRVKSPYTPWVLVTTTLDDPSVPFWHGAKWLCRRRIRELTARTYWGASHGVGVQGFFRLCEDGGHAPKKLTGAARFARERQEEAEVVGFLEEAIPAYQ